LGGTFLKHINVSDSFVALKPSYDRFARVQIEISMCQDRDIQIDVDIKNRFGYTFVFLFSTLPYVARKHNKNLKIFCNEKSFTLFKKLGVIPKELIFQAETDYCCDLERSAVVISEAQDIFELVTEITHEAPVQMSEELSSLFISKAGEMYNNAMEHSQGTVIGSKYFKNQKGVYCFSCYDTGVGIPAKVMASQHNIASAIDAFRWAMVPGNSTASGNIPRGLGLGLLKNFANANDGTIRICSGNVLYIYKNSREDYYELNHTFDGTLFEMDIIADNDRRYILG
jgi:hypothetical protein